MVEMDPANPLPATAWSHRIRGAHARHGATAGLAAALAAAATGRHEAQAATLTTCLSLGVSAELLVEGALMTHLFSGFPRAIEAFAIVEDTVRRAGGVWPIASTPAGDATPTARRDAGAAVFTLIYGAQADRVRARLAQFSPAFEHAVLEDAYGRILARPGLDTRTRELMSVCVLTALDLPRQLHSHLKGALAAGAKVDDIEEMVNLAADLVAAWPATRPDIDGARALSTQVVATLRRP